MRQVYTSDSFNGSTQFARSAADTCPELASKLEGVNSFEGQSFHTYYWPQELADLAGKKVAVISTGATGAQLISTVFQRRPNWFAPLHNSAIDDETQAKISSYDEIFERCREAPGGFLHGPDRKGTANDVKDAGGRAARLLGESSMTPPASPSGWATSATSWWTRGLTPSSPRLSPTRSGDGPRLCDGGEADPVRPRFRQASRSNEDRILSYEAFNRDNVHLVDLNDMPIERSLRMACARPSATTSSTSSSTPPGGGFDAVTGAFDRIEFIGAEGRRFAKSGATAEHLSRSPDRGIPQPDHPGRTTGRVGVEQLPALDRGRGRLGDRTRPLHQPRVLNHRGAQQLHTRSRLHPSGADSRGRAGVRQHVKDIYSVLPLSKAKSWFTGCNSNIQGNPRYLIYNGGAPKYRKRLAQVASNEYEGVRLRMRAWRRHPSTCDGSGRPRAIAAPNGPNGSCYLSSW